MNINGIYLGNTYYGDDEVNIAIDYEGQQSVPDGIVNTPYKIFNASGYDVLGNPVPVRARVFYQHGSSSLEINTRDDYFTPQLPGTLSDRSGDADVLAV